MVTRALFSKTLLPFQHFTRQYHASTISMGMDILAYKFADGRTEMKKEVQLGKRRPVEKDAKILIESHQIYGAWRNSDPETWPIELRYFWSKLERNNKSVKEVVRNIRNYYPVDTELLSFADWLEQFDDNVFFEISLVL